MRVCLTTPIRYAAACWLFLSAIPLQAAGVQSTQSESCGCGTVFDTTVEKVTTNYAGYPDKGEEFQRELARRTELLRNRTGDTSREACIELLNEWIRIFEDFHLHLQWDSSFTWAEELMPPDPGPRNPTFEALDSEYVFLKIPSFAGGYKEELDGLLDTHRVEILSASTLIVDIRGNGGGTEFDDS